MRGKGKCALGVLAVSFAFLCLAGDASALSYVALGDSLAVGSGDGGGGGYLARYRDDLATDLTTTTSSSGTSTIPSCAGSACSGCGACGDGVCFAAGSGTCTHSGPGAVCASNASCSFSACSSDTDCGPGKVCGIAGMLTVCCAVCP